MSEPAYCDHCGKEGRRRRMRHSPDGWFYAEVVMSGEICVGWVCSEACRDLLFRAGPGDLLAPDSLGPSGALILERIANAVAFVAMVNIAGERWGDSDLERWGLLMRMGVLG